MKTTLHSTGSVPILVVDDDRDDQFFLKEALLHTIPRALIESLYDGAEALQYLIKCITPPNLIFLDLNMCKISGRETLNFIKKKSRFKKIPVIILTTSKSEDEKKELLEMGADEFYSKPDSVDKLEKIVKDVRNKWLIDF
jgi:CheY-like chemotaxis protein